MPVLIDKIPEATLIPIIKSGFLQSLGFSSSDNFVTEEEFSSVYGIPDVVFYNFNQSVLEKRIRKNINPVLSKSLMKTLLLIEGKQKISFTFLTENLPFSADVIRKDLIDFLLKNDILSNSNESEVYDVSDELRSTTDNFFSIEAKVSNWKRGFYQAYRYKWFSNVSFLALHKNHIRPALHHYSLFEEHNIGLAMVDTDLKGMEVLYKPRIEAPYSKEMAFTTYERLFSNYLEKRQQANLDSSSL